MIAGPPARSRLLALLRHLALLTAVVAGCGGPPTAPVPQGPLRARVLPDPEATAVGAAVVVPGSAWELPGTEGLTILAAHTLLEQMRPALESLGARAAVECDPAAFTFTLVAAPDEWRTALAVFLAGLFRPDPGAAAFERAREGLRRSLVLDRANPGWQARLAVRRALHGDTARASGWSAPACGVPEALAVHDLAHTRAAAHRFDPRRAAAVVIGPVQAPAARSILRSWLPPPEGPPVATPSARPGRHVYVERNTINAWLSVGFPFPAGADVEAIRLLGAAVEAAVEPGLAHPDVFDAGTEILRHAAGGALVVHAVVAPGSAARYAALLETTVRDAATRPIGHLEAVRRRQLGRRLLELAAPEARAAAHAFELALDSPAAGGADTARTGPSGWPDPGSVSESRLRSAAGSLGRGVRVVVGPAAARPAAGS